MSVHHDPAGKSRTRTRSFAAALCIAMMSLGASSEATRDPVPLPKPSVQGSVSIEQALTRRRSIRRFDPAPLSPRSLSQLVWAAQGVTDERGLRTAPSAGALYPLEVYVVPGAVSGLAPGVYHYDPKRHRLARTAVGEFRDRLAAAAYGQDWIADAPAVLVLAADHDRTLRKYGSRASRYVHMEVGHAAQNVYLQAEGLALGTCFVGAFSDEAIKELLGLPADLAPLGLMPVGKPGP